MEVDDRGHRPHAEHWGETPEFKFLYGPDGINVTLDTWGPSFGFDRNGQAKENLLAVMFNSLQANWGEHPSRVEWDDDLTPGQREFAIKAFQGKTLPQVLEGITFWFTIDGISRACTHQLVRSRIGAGFMQHGGRDNDWRHRGFRCPETIRRAGIVREQGVMALAPLKHCITDWYPIEALTEDASLNDVLVQHVEQNRRIYARLVDAGIPWQDARRFLMIGSTTYLHAQYNLAALRGVLANRLEHIMDWEINCVAQLMLREINLACPPYIYKHLGSHSDLQGKAAMEHLDSWPPDGKWPCSPEAATTPRKHRPEQMPFFVLTPAAMAGGSIEWIRTNGLHPNSDAEIRHREDQP